MKSTTMKKNSTTPLILSAIVVGLILSSCRRDRFDDDNIGQDYATSDAIFTEAHSIADEAEQSGTISLKVDDFMGITAGNCAVVSKDSTSIQGTKRITVDFGSGCQGFDGRTRKGKVLVTYTGRYKDSGTVITINFDGYSVNDNLVDNSSVKTVTNSTQQGGNLKWNVVVSGKVTLANGKGVVVWTANRMRELIAGSTSPQLNDDIYLITGSSSGTTATNKSFTANITSPLRKDFSCVAGKRGFTAGTIDINVAGKLRVLDFGAGACDNVFTITINGKTYTISL
jgi:hypothetical protein